MLGWGFLQSIQVRVRVMLLSWSDVLDTSTSVSEGPTSLSCFGCDENSKRCNSCSLFTGWPERVTRTIHATGKSIGFQQRHCSELPFSFNGPQALKHVESCLTRSQPLDIDSIHPLMEKEDSYDFDDIDAAILKASCSVAAGRACIPTLVFEVTSRAGIVGRGFVSISSLELSADSVEAIVPLHPQGSLSFRCIAKDTFEGSVAAPVIDSKLILPNPPSFGTLSVQLLKAVVNTAEVHNRSVQFRMNLKLESGTTQETKLFTVKRGAGFDTLAPQDLKIHSPLGEFEDAVENNHSVKEFYLSGQPCHWELDDSRGLISVLLVDRTDFSNVLALAKVSLLRVQVLILLSFLFLYLFCNSYSPPGTHDPICVYAQRCSVTSTRLSNMDRSF